MIPGRKVQTDGVESEISIDAGKVELEGTLGIPKETSAIVLFAHGVGAVAIARETVTLLRCFNLKEWEHCSLIS